jgi:hypothetical protein
VGAGATLRLPVNVDGALVAFGDAHGAQGDGEITGVAVEIEAEVELTMRVRDRDAAGFVALPQLDTAEAIGSLAGLHGADLTSCARTAYTDLVERLHRGHGFARTDAYHLLGQAGRLQHDRPVLLGAGHRRAPLPGAVVGRYRKRTLSAARRSGSVSGTPTFRERETECPSECCC